MRKNSAIIALIALVPVWHASPAPARADAGEKKGLFGGSPLTWSIEPIVDRYVKQMARHYNLNPDQEEYSRQLLNLRVKRFLKEYEKDTRSLFAEYYYYQINKEMPSAEAAKDWARRGGPLVAAIRKEIVDGNMEWRRILNEEQKGKHDRDLEIMNRQFQQFDQQMERWSRGEVRPADIGRSGSPPPRSITRFEDAWEFRVRSFVEAYKLDAGQRQTAYSILRELRGQAARYREKHQKEFDDLDARFTQITQADPKDPKKDAAELQRAREKLEELRQRRMKLEHPIRVELFNQLLARLERIPTEDQRQERQAHLNRLNARVGYKKRPATRPAGATQPATTSRPAAPSR